MKATGEQVRTVELFAGGAVFSEEARKAGCDTLATDLIQYGNADLVGDIMDPKVFRKLVKHRPQVVWASPPCTGFSIAAVGKSFSTRLIGTERTYFPKSVKAALGVALVLRTWQYIDAVTALTGVEPLYYIENPMGLLGKLPIMDRAPIRHKITHCRYGHNAMKPTHIWTNDSNWTPRAPCRNGGWGVEVVDGKAWALKEDGSPCHEQARRGSKTGTQGLTGAYTRALLPVELCVEVVHSALQQVGS